MPRRNFALARRWFEACRIPQHGWTRNYKTALLYFRDPSGNLFELYCDSGYEDIRELALGPRQGGRPLPLEALQYQWNGAVGNAAERPRIRSFGHLSMPVRDIEQSKRFFIEVMGGEPMSTSDPETFTEVRLAGAVVGLSTRGGVPTGRDVEYPHYAFHADAVEFPADDRVAQIPRGGNAGSVDARRQQSFDVLSRSLWKPARDLSWRRFSGGVNLSARHQARR